MTTYQYDYLLWLQAKRDFPDIDHRHQEPVNGGLEIISRWFPNLYLQSVEQVKQQCEQITREFRRGE